MFLGNLLTFSKYIKDYPIWKLLLSHNYIYLDWVQITLGVTLNNVTPINIF